MFLRGCRSWLSAMVMSYGKGTKMFVRPILREAKFAYAQQIQGPGHPINLLGIGPSARSAIFGVGSFQAQQHEQDFVIEGTD